MSEHRYPCTAEAPELLQPSGPVAGALGNHRHACIHDATPEPTRDTGRLIEHRCECGMTWTVAEWQPKPPPDLTWFFEFHERQRERYEQQWHRRFWRALKETMGVRG